MNLSPRNKYGARKVTVDNIEFHSAAEAKRYGELKLLQRAKLIHDLELQPVFEFKVNDKVVFRYIADFRYRADTATAVVEDVKGMKTPEYKLKKRLIEAQLGIKITEVAA